MARRGDDDRVTVEGAVGAQQYRPGSGSGSGIGSVADRSRRTVARMSATNLFAPRGEPVAPLRSREPTITGAEVAVETMPIRAFRPRTPE
jgi:hypothetical protein